MLYKLFILFPILLLLLSKNQKNSTNSKVLIFLFLVLIWTFSTFREYILPSDMLGMDYYNYQNWYNDTNSIIKLQNSGFNFLILFTKFFGDNYIIFLGICNFIILTCFYMFLKENSDDFRYSFFLFITFGILELSFNGLRQCIACSIWLLSFKYLYKEKSVVKYLIITVIASLFHSSAFTLILLYPIFRINIKIIYRIVLLLPFFVILRLDSIRDFILQNSVSIDEIYLNRYTTSNFSTSNLVVFFVSVIVLIVAILKIKKMKKSDQKSNVFINYLLLLILFGFIAPIHIIYSRMLIYFMPALVIALPYIFTLYNKDELKMMKTCCTFLFLLMYFI